MEQIRKIQNFIINNDIENAYETIMKNEKEYINNHIYWNLRGMLCSKIHEYNVAINCFKTAIDIDESYTDAYFNIVYTYKLIGEKLKSVIYGGISFRYCDDDFKKEIYSIYEDEHFKEKYKDLLNEMQLNLEINLKKTNIVNYIASQFNNIEDEYISLLCNSEIGSRWAYLKGNHFISNGGILSMKYIVENNNKYEVIVPYNIDYISSIRNMALAGIMKCYIIVPTKNNKLELIEVNSEEMESLKNEDYKRTITLNKFNAADSNVYALIKYIPQKYKEKYKLNIIHGRDVLNIENVVKVPLISSMTISGFNTFMNYPKFTYNIDVGHASIIMKNCGIMDKKYKDFSFTPKEYENIDKVCITSKMNMILLSAFSAIPENKYIVTGNPRTDTLLLANGKENIEKLIERSIEGKKIIFNMPTFHIHENSGIINGSVFNDSIKIKGFNYKRFDKFLKENNIICISKVHHAEERTITSKVQDRKLENLLFISNKDLEDKNLDLYEVLNCADGLITDYSSIYGDFLFMNKPIVFVNADIEEYRKERGISLEPYDFWTAGPKVQNQDVLEKEILKSLFDEEYYKQKREELRDVFYENKDSSASLRVWEHIDEVLSN
ncbi:CDP-glycerol glycerophosphotransferase family protein [Terrisporobacter vanillatitrophus]|uniref:CDP-glycerol glycerophosphotransferase family protein n=1 Tax=Terrisporobacter vanillatitrophus TaxID=3058402 RepID=UPI003368A014